MPRQVLVHTVPDISAGCHSFVGRCCCCRSKALGGCRSFIIGWLSFAVLRESLSHAPPPLLMVPVRPLLSPRDGGGAHDAHSKICCF